MQSQQSLILIKNQGFFPANVSYTNGLGDLHHLLARRPTNILWLLTRTYQQRLTFSKSNYFKVWHHLPKIKLHSYRGVLTLNIKQHVFIFHDRPLKTCVAWGRSLEVEEGEGKGVRNGSCSGKVIFSVDSQSVLPEMPFSGLANLLWLWSILTPVHTHTLTWGLPSGPVIST